MHSAHGLHHLAVDMSPSKILMREKVLDLRKSIMETVKIYASVDITMRASFINMKKLIQRMVRHFVAGKER